MVKLVYNFRDLPLGELQYDVDSKEYIYNSYIKNEAIAKKQTLGLLDYHLYNSRNLKSKDLFIDFKMWIDHNRGDIIKMCKIGKDDSDWEKLVKIAKINNITMGDYKLSVIE